ncbi:MAG: copper resistance protein B [Alphaproteobacteria bacterium]
MKRFVTGVLVGFLSAGMAYGEEERSGWYAADEIYGSSEMEAAEETVREHHGGGTTLFLQADRLEYQTGDGDPLLVWDAQGWFGGPLDKFWVKAEGEYLIDAGNFEEAEFQALYSHAIGPYFDLQAGARYDIEPDPSRAYGVIGIQGLAPQWFEIDAAAFISHEGDVSARFEAEYELMLTQRLILQPRTELNFAVQRVEDLGIGSGLSTAEAGLRLRYEIIRKFAPYIGVSWNWKVGETAAFARAEGEDTESVSFVAGLRMWY